MGRTSDEEGETSTRTCKSDDIDDRPLKKARYVWQIKGKYHLKKPEEEKNSPFLSKAKGSEECSRVAANPCAHVDYQDHIPEYDYQLLGTNKVEEMDVKLDENIRISAREDSSASMINPAGNKVNLNHSSQDVPVATRAEISRFFRSHVASTLLLRKWQARQVARCFVDNTINRVLEDMGFVPLPVDADDIVDEEFPMTESENDDGLEDEAVLMAIHSHGLQRNEGEPSGSSGGNLKEHEVREAEQPVVNYFCKGNSIGASHCACSLTQRVTDTVESLDPFHQRPVNRLWDQIQLDTDRYQELENMSHQLVDELKTTGNVMNRWCSDGGLFNALVHSESSSDSDSKGYEEDCSCDTKQNSLIRTEDDGEIIPVARIKGMIVQEPKTVSESLSSDSLVEVKIEEKTSSSSSPSSSSSSLEHNDFLDKAVAVAIQKKGLSTFSCTDYG